MRFFFPRNGHRLTTPQHFNTLYASALRVSSKHVVMFYGPNENNESKKAFVASKKVGNSVLRNRSKRVIKEVVRLNQHDLSKGYDYVFVARPGFGMCGFASIQNELVFLFKKSGVWL